MRGITVTLYETTESGRDALNNPILVETPVQVDNVLVGEPTSDDVVSSTAMFGKQIQFMLGIPKGDTHDWTDAEVEIWGERFRTIGYPETGIQANIPLRWGQNIKVERYG